MLMTKYKEKIAKELKEINDIVYRYINMDENSEYTFKLIDIVNAIDYFLCWLIMLILIGEKQSKVISKNLFFCVYIKLLITLCK